MRGTILTRKLPLTNPGSAETTEGPQTEEELLAQEKEKSEKPSNLPKELEDKLEKAEDNGREVDKDQLAQDTGKLVPEDVAKTSNGELNYGATVKIKTPSGEGSGIVVAKDLVLTVSHNLSRIAKTAISVRLWIMTKGMEISIASHIQDCQMSSLARKISFIGIVKAT